MVALLNAEANWLARLRGISRRGVLALALLSQVACAPLATLPLSEEVDLEVHAMHAGADRFDARVRFVNRSAFPAVVQEGSAEGGVRFVEKFSAAPVSGYDHHFGTNLPADGVRRAFIVYAGETLDTADTSSGFALLPTAADGAPITRLAPDFNARYQLQSRIQGRVVARSPAEGWWVIRWTPDRLRLLTPSGEVVYEHGQGVRVVYGARAPDAPLRP